MPVYTCPRLFALGIWLLPFAVRNTWIKPLWSPCRSLISAGQQTRDRCRFSARVANPWQSPFLIIILLIMPALLASGLFRSSPWPRPEYNWIKKCVCPFWSRHFLLLSVKFFFLPIHQSIWLFCLMDCLVKLLHNYKFVWICNVRRRFKKRWLSNLVEAPEIANRKKTFIFGRVKMSWSKCFEKVRDFEKGVLVKVQRSLRTEAYLNCVIKTETLKIHKTKTAFQNLTRHTMGPI